MLGLSTCATLIKLAVFFPSRQRNALPIPLSHLGLTPVTQSYMARLQLTSSYSCYANSTGCALCADLISSYLYSITKPECLYDLVCPYQPTKALRSASNKVDFDWPTRVTRVILKWYPVCGNLHCARSTTRVIQLNSDNCDHGDKPFK